MRAPIVHFGEFVPPKLSLTEGSIPRTLLFFSLPILFRNVLQPVNGSMCRPAEIDAGGIGG